MSTSTYTVAPGERIRHSRDDRAMTVEGLIYDLGKADAEESCQQDGKEEPRKVR